MVCLIFFLKIQQWPSLNLFYKIFNTTISQEVYPERYETTTNLTCFYQFITNVDDNKDQVDAVFTDFSKVFLQNTNQTLQMIDFLFIFRSYLKIHLPVQYNKYMCLSYKVYSEVPQGSNLEPLLYLSLSMTSQL